MSNGEQKKLYEFQKIIKELKKFRGSGTQLVSLYIPAGYPIPEVASKIRAEISQAQNIKSKQTRTNVIGALERILAVLKNYRQTPPNGLVIFSGNVSEDPSKQDIRTFVVEPIYKLNMSIYRCDSTFFLEPLEKMLESRDSYGIVVMDGREATLAILRGTEYQILKTIESKAHAKVRKGGQSARRYERLIEEQTEYYYKKVGEAMDQLFLGKVKGIIIGGPGPTKEYFLDMKPFNYQHKIIGVVDTGYTDEHGVREVIAKADQFIAEQEAIKEKKLIERFIKTVVHGGKATYGLKPVLDYLNESRVDTLLVSMGLEMVHVVYQCPNGHQVEKFFSSNEVPESTKCPKCGENMRIVDEEDIQDYFIARSEHEGFTVELISTNTHEGMQFLNGFGGIGAFLRW